LKKSGKFDKLVFVARAIRYRKLNQRRYYRLNQYIFATEVRVVDEKGKQIGVMPISQALQQARNLNLDLVEVVPKAQPPICKIINFKKFLFLEEKKAAEQKRKTKKTKLKEIQLTPFIAKNDLENRLNRVEEFLKEGNKVRLVVKFRGREMAKKDFGYRLIEQALIRLKDIAGTDMPPRFLGRQLETVLTPVKSQPAARLPAGQGRQGEKNVKKTENENQKVNL